MQTVALAVHGWYHPASETDSYFKYLSMSLNSVGVANYKLEGYHIPFGTISQAFFASTLRYILKYKTSEDLIHDIYGDSVFRGVDVATIQDLYWNTDQHTYLTKAIQIIQRIYQSYYRTLKYARRVIATTSFTKNQLIKYYGKKFSNKIDIIPIPCEPIISENCGSYQYDVIWIGTSQLRKLPIKFIKAISKLPKSFRIRILIKPTSTIISENMNYIRSLVQQYLSEGRKVELTETRLNAEALNHLYQSSKCLVSTSEYEGFHMPVAEAYLRGTCVVLPDIEVYKAQYNNEEGIFWYSPFSDNLAETIERAVQYGRFNVDKKVKERLSLKNVGRLLMNTYGKLETR